MATQLEEGRALAPSGCFPAPSACSSPVSCSWSAQQCCFIPEQQFLTATATESKLHFIHFLHNQPHSTSPGQPAYPLQRGEGPSEGPSPLQRCLHRMSSTRSSEGCILRRLRSCSPGSLSFYTVVIPSSFCSRALAMEVTA